MRERTRTADRTDRIIHSLIPPSLPLSLILSISLPLNGAVIALLLSVEQIGRTASLFMCAALLLIACSALHCFTPDMPNLEALQTTPGQSSSSSSSSSGKTKKD